MFRRNYGNKENGVQEQEYTKIQIWDTDTRDNLRVSCLTLN